jgi:hypothetical protein
MAVSAGLRQDGSKELRSFFKTLGSASRDFRSTYAPTLCNAPQDSGTTFSALWTGELNIDQVAADLPNAEFHLSCPRKHAFALGFQFRHVGARLAGFKRIKRAHIPAELLLEIQRAASSVHP